MAEKNAVDVVRSLAKTLLDDRQITLREYNAIVNALTAPMSAVVWRALPNSSVAFSGHRGTLYVGSVCYIDPSHEQSWLPGYYLAIHVTGVQRKFATTKEARDWIESI